MKMEEMTYEQLQDTHELLNEIQAAMAGHRGYYKFFKDGRTHLVNIDGDETYVAIDGDHEDARPWLCKLDNPSMEFECDPVMTWDIYGLHKFKDIPDYAYGEHHVDDHTKNFLSDFQRMVNV